MSFRYANVIWAIVLIGLGSLLLAQSLGFLQDLSWQIWVLICAGLSVLFLVSYLLSGIQNWGWLFPALIFGAVAGVITLGASGYGDPAIATPLMIAVGAPFLVAFALNPRQHWWALIPAWVMGVLAGLLLFVDRVQGELIGAYILFAIGLPFLIVYVVDRTRWWALIPGGVLMGIGVVVLLTTQLSGESIGTVVLLVVALPFLAVYAASPNRNWWALIPAGILASVALMVLFVADRDLPDEAVARLSGILFLGAAVTFGLLWLRRNTVPTAWAIYPAGALAILALLAFALGTAIELVWPVVLIGLGLLLLVFSLRPRQQH